MRFTGTLRTWHHDRGFGFIAPTQGGAELFVHISALPRDRSRPLVGERLSFEMGRNGEGKPQAVNVRREALAPSAIRRTAKQEAHPHRRWWGTAVLVVLVTMLATYGYSKYTKQVQRSASAAPELRSALTRPPLVEAAPPATVSFNCDGRKYCSQMTSCEEAKRFLANCPGMEMDGNNDGVPCESQWCTGSR